MRDKNLSTVSSWPEPTSIKALQRFLGLTNFYRCFIQDYSAVAVQQTDLLRGKKSTRFLFNPKAQETLKKLKIAFIFAPIFKKIQSLLPWFGVHDCAMQTFLLYLPCEFNVVMITAVYIPPDANANSALKHLHSSIGSQHLDLKTVFLKLHQHVKCATRGANT